MRGRAKFASGSFLWCCPESLIALPVFGLAFWLAHDYDSHPRISQNPELHYRKGETLHAQNDLAGAVAEYREAIHLKPDYAAAHAGLGFAFRDQGDLENTIAEFREVIRLTPQNAEAHYNLANVLNKNDDRDGAITEYRETLRLKPDFAKSHPMPELAAVEKKENPPVAGNAHSGSSAKSKAAEKNPATRMRVAGNVQMAKLVNRVSPEYPPVARQTRVAGMVRLHAIIGKDGTVQELDVISGHPLLLQAAVNAVRQWRYAPTLWNGQPVEVDTMVELDYTLLGMIPRPLRRAPGPDTATAASGPSSATLQPANSAPCTLGKVTLTERGNVLIGSVSYTYNASYALDSVALRGMALKAEGRPISGLHYAQSTLKTAKDSATFSIEGHPSLSRPGEQGEYVLVSIVVKQSGATVCDQLVPYHRKW